MRRQARTFAFLAVLLAVAAPTGAAEWGSDKVPVPAPGGNSSLGVAGHPAVVGPDGSVELVFQSYVNPESARVVYAHRDPGGAWASPELISPPDRLARNPCVALDRMGSLHVFWEDYTEPGGNIVHRERLADGTWRAPETVSAAPGLSRDPVAAVDAFDRVHVVWVDGRSDRREIMHAVLAPGQDWSAGDVLSPGSDSPDEPSVTADSVGAVHVVWRDRDASVRNGYSSQIIYVRLGPETVDPHPVRLVDKISISQTPFIMAAPDGTLHLVWADNRPSTIGIRSGYFDVYYKRYLPGVGWGHDKQFSWDGTDHARPILTLGAGNTVNICWEDYRFGNPEIYYRQITPETGWDPDPSRLTSDAGSSQSPALLSVPGGGILLLWADARGSGDYTLYARTGTTAP
jgi:hypothetical protein